MLKRPPVTNIDPHPKVGPAIQEVIEGFDDQALCALGSGVGSAERDARRKVTTFEEGKYTMTIHNVLAGVNLTQEGSSLDLNLDDVADCFRWAYFDKTEFPSCRVDLRWGEVDYSISIFRSGRIQCTGGVDVTNVEKLLLRCAKRLATNISSLDASKCGIEAFSVQNILAVMDLSTSMCLPRLINLVPGGADYEPEKFPAARFKLPVDEHLDEQLIEEIASTAEQPPARPQGQTIARGRGGRQILLDTRSTAQKAKQQFMRAKEKANKENVTVNIFGTGKVTLTGGKSLRSIKYAWRQLHPYVERCIKGPEQVPVAPVDASNQPIQTMQTDDVNAIESVAELFSTPMQIVPELDPAFGGGFQ